MERFLMCAITVIFTVAVYADDAPDYPQKETLYPLEGDINSSLINLNCRRDQSTEFLDCDILQVTFDKPALEDGLVDAEIDEATRMFDEEFCKHLDTPQWSLDDPAIQDLLKASSSTDVASMKIILQICAESDARKRRSLFKQLIEQNNEKLRKTCRMLFFPSSKRFTWDRPTNQWRVVTEGRNACGTVTVQSLQSEDGTWWRYASQTIVSEPNGKEPITGLSCQEFHADTRPLIFAARGNAIKMNCQIIGESWTK